MFVTQGLLFEYSKYSYCDGGHFLTFFVVLNTFSFSNSTVAVHSSGSLVLARTVVFAVGPRPSEVCKGIGRRFVQGQGEDPVG